MRFFALAALAGAAMSVPAVAAPTSASATKAEGSSRSTTTTSSTKSTAKATSTTSRVSLPTSTSSVKSPLLCQYPTQNSPSGCQGNLIQIQSSPNTSLIGQYAYVPPAQNEDNHIGATLSFTRNVADANTFAITTDVYGEIFLNATQTGRYSFWNPTTQIGGSDNSDYHAWPVNFLAPIYGSTRITPTFDSGTRALGLEVRETGGYGSLVAAAKMPLVCGGQNATVSPYLVVSDEPLSGCVSVTLVWI